MRQSPQVTLTPCSNRLKGQIVLLKPPLLALGKRLTIFSPEEIRLLSLQQRSRFLHLNILTDIRSRPLLDFILCFYQSSSDHRNASIFYEDLLPFLRHSPQHGFIQRYFIELATTHNLTRLARKESRRSRHRSSDKKAQAIPSQQQDGQIPKSIAGSSSSRINYQRPCRSIWRHWR